ncbi:MAG: MmcQ/YjbR family DNA-binding protein [Acidobacteria bacterium]|nr:MmcQ/YjbR family DNA-binding protein [Acidobacteriota bacterium]
MTPADFRRLALSLPEMAEGSHFNVQDFRVGGKIFATLAYEKLGFGVLLLTPEQQAGMTEDAPDIFSPVPNGWGRHGATLVRLSIVKKDIMEAALRTAWTNRQLPARRSPRRAKKQGL